MTKPALLLVALALWASVAQAAPSPSPSPHRRPRIADLDRPASKRKSFVRTLENALPLSLALFLGLRGGNIHLKGGSGPVSSGD